MGIARIGVAFPRGLPGGEHVVLAGRGTVESRRTGLVEWDGRDP